MDLRAIRYELEVNFLFRFFEFQTFVKPLIRTKRYFHSFLPMSVYWIQYTPSSIVYGRQI